MSRRDEHAATMIPASSSWIATLLVVLFVGCESGKVESVFGGSENLEVVRNAATVEAYRISAEGLEDQWGKATVVDYDVVAGPVAVPKGELTKLREILSSSNTYGWSFAKGCLPTPGVRVRFDDGRRTVDVLLCFECDILGVFVDGTLVGGEDFDDARSSLVEIVKTIFPNDTVIQSLSSNETDEASAAAMEP